MSATLHLFSRCSVEKSATHLGVGLLLRGSFETKWFASVSIPLDSTASDRGIRNKGAGMSARGIADIVESESYSREGVCGPDNGFFTGDVRPAIGVTPSLEDTVDGGSSKEGSSNTGGSSFAGVVMVVEGSDSTSPDFVSFSSASDTVNPATFRSSELKTS